MKRKMLKEEETLKSWWPAIEFPNDNKSRYFYDIRALVRACYEDAAKVAGDYGIGTKHEVHCLEVSAAIRGKK